jgi:uncharacterized protein YecT (DUF1311 family)
LLATLTMVLVIATAGEPTKAEPRPETAIPCSKDEVLWNGRCFHRYQWESDWKTCPRGVVIVPDGEDLPRCVPCGDDKVRMQQPMNYCADLLRLSGDRDLDRALAAVVKEFPRRAGDLEKAHGAWIKWRDAECEVERNRYDGGSMAPQVFEECQLQLNGDRIKQLNALQKRWTAEGR